MSNSGNAPQNLGKAHRRISGGRFVEFLRHTSGVTAIEFALTFPVLMLIVMGALEFGRALEARNQISHALSRAVRVVDLDADRTASEIAALMAGYLDEFDEDDLTIGTSTTTTSGVEYMDISVAFPFDVIIPFASVSSVTLNVQTRTPVISASQ